MKRDPFYAQGLRFGCTRCSGCCRGGPGFVFLSSQDVSRLLLSLNCDFPYFFKRYCRLFDTGTGYSLSLIEKPDFDCVMWTDQGCAVYEARPVQCSTYPFWSGIMDSEVHWLEESRSCPGIGRGEMSPRAEIEDALYSRRAAGTLVLPYDFDPDFFDPGQVAHA